VDRKNEPHSLADSGLVVGASVPSKGTGPRQPVTWRR
jgi:hypothetical protein